MRMRYSSALAAQPLDNNDDGNPGVFASRGHDAREIELAGQREFELVQRDGKRSSGASRKRGSVTSDRPARDVAQLGLRERKKRFTRETIAAAAFDLATEQGLDVTTLDAIAERAFVSPRTISNYFRSKEAAVVAASEAAFESVVDAVETARGDLALLPALRESLRVAIEQWSAETCESLHATEQLVSAHPALLPYRTAQYDAFERRLSALIAVRLGSDTRRSALPSLAAGMVITVLKASIALWMQSGPGAPGIVFLVDRAFVEFADGLAAGR